MVFFPGVLLVVFAPTALIFFFLSQIAEGRKPEASPPAASQVSSQNAGYENDYKFTGQELDPETNLYYYGARYYNPKLGQFASPDPWEGDLRDPQSLNKYSYVRNNPMKYVDPNGQFFGLPLSLPFSWFADISIPEISIPEVSIPVPGEVFIPFAPAIPSAPTMPLAPIAPAPPMAKIIPETTQPPPSWSGVIPKEGWKGGDSPQEENFSRGGNQENWYNNKLEEGWRYDEGHGNIRPHYDYHGKDGAYRYYFDTETWQQKQIGPLQADPNDLERYNREMEQYQKDNEEYQQNLEQYNKDLEKYEKDYGGFVRA
ncbi:hypothetical protein HZA38_02555 [Candidatus Peregrinibacteria bacterium]|nr:hypothetical protein [Candidatus Peregrinibacteria bacterium]